MKTKQIVSKVIYCLRYCFLLTKDCMHNEVWGCAETLPKRQLIGSTRRNTGSNTLSLNINIHTSQVATFCCHMLLMHRIIQGLRSVKLFLLCSFLACCFRFNGFSVIYLCCLLAVPLLPNPSRGLKYLLLYFL